MKNVPFEDTMTYLSADHMRVLQRKISTCKSTIINDVLTIRFKRIFSEEEIDVLNKASEILGCVKNRVEQVKEKNLIKERACKSELDGYREMRCEILEELIPLPKTEEENREMVMMLLAIYLNAHTFPNTYSIEMKYVRSWLESAADNNFLHRSLSEFPSRCRGEIIRFLDSELWHYDEKPEREKLQDLLLNCHENWLAHVMKNQGCLDVISTYDAETAAQSSQNARRL